MRAKRSISIVALVLLVAANALTLLPLASPFQPYLSAAALALGLVVLIAMFGSDGPRRDTAKGEAAATRPVPVPTYAGEVDAEIVSFLAMLQARGRFVDFLM